MKMYCDQGGPPYRGKAKIAVRFVLLQAIVVAAVGAQFLEPANNWRQLLRQGRVLSEQQKFLEAEDTLVKAL